MTTARVENDDWPLFAVVIKNFGSNRSKVFGLIRELMGFSPADTKAIMQRPEVEVARGPHMLVEPLLERLRSAGAEVSLRVIGSSQPLSVTQVLADPVRAWLGPAAVEGHLVVTTLFSYLATGRHEQQGILVDQSQVEARLLERVPVMCGSMVSYSGRALVEGVLSSPTGIPMFPALLHSIVAVTYFHPGWEPVRIEFS